MQPTNPHPTDEQLFDYMGGTLSRAQAVEVSGHISTCLVCAAALRDAQASMPWARGAVAAMPPAAAARMHEALAAEFELRAPGRIAASAGTGRGRTATGAGGWRRWLVPALAFGMLAALAGVSVLGLGDEGSRSSNGGVPTAQQAAGGDERARGDVGNGSGGVASPKSAAAPALGQPEATTGGLQDVAPTASPTAKTDVARESNAVTGAPGEVETTAGPGGIRAPIGGDDRVAAQDAGEQPPNPNDFAPPGQAQADAAPDGAVPAASPAAGDVAIEASNAAGETCAVSFDGVTPVLPDGRVPLRVTRGPFGIVVACG